MKTIRTDIVKEKVENFVVGFSAWQGQIETFEVQRTQFKETFKVILNFRQRILNMLDFTANLVNNLVTYQLKGSVFQIRLPRGYHVNENLQSITFQLRYRP